MKLPRYAESGISEVWIVDVPQQIIAQYTQPLQGQYTRIQKHLKGNAIQSTVLAQLSFSTDQLFK